MESDAVIEEIIHVIMIIFESVKAKKSPAIKPVKDTIASCIPSTIAARQKELFFILCVYTSFFLLLPQVQFHKIFIANMKICSMIKNARE